MTFCHSPHPLDPKLNPYPTAPPVHGCYFFTLRLVTPFHPFNFGSGVMGGVAECHQSMYWMLLFFAKHGTQDRCSKQILSLVCAARKSPSDPCRSGLKSASHLYISRFMGVLQCLEICIAVVLMLTNVPRDARYASHLH